MGERFKKRVGKLSERVRRKFNVSLEEVYVYLTAETYEEDAYSLEEALSNDYLLFHELLEIEYLKGKGLRITSRVIVENPEAVYEYHLKVLEGELKLALRTET